MIGTYLQVGKRTDAHKLYCTPGFAHFLYDEGKVSSVSTSIASKEHHLSAIIMDQFFQISSQWRVAICIQCQHAVWPSSVAGHSKGVHHRLSTKEASRIKREVQEASVI